MNEVASKIEIGRRVRFFAGYGGIDDDGLIVAIHGQPNPTPPESILNGIGRVIRHNDCQVDVILFDGRSLPGIHQCGIDAPGIGIKLLDRVHGPAMIEAAKRNAAAYEAHKVVEAARARQAFEEAEAARKIDDAPVFFWNGIKDAKGAKLQRCHYSESSLRSLPAGTLTIYARDYARFSAKVRACFAVENDSDSQVDYFDNDRIRVIPSHPLYAKVKAAMDACSARYAKRAGGAA